jgi:hypothetical protein
MPMIDVYVEADLFLAKSLRVLGTDLTQAVLRAEGVANPPISPQGQSVARARSKITEKNAVEIGLML